MSDDDDDDLFGGLGGGDDSDDTNELIGNSKKSSNKKKDDKPDADADKGLFDSDSDDSDDDGGAAVAKKKKVVVKKKELSKREKLEAMAKKRQKEAAKKHPKKKSISSNKDNSKGVKKEKDNNSGYDSGDSYDSGNFERTKEDDDFLDTTGEDQDAVKELYADQHFDDEAPDRDDDDGRGGGRGGGKGSSASRKRRDRGDNPDNVGDASLEPDNPIMAAVHRMKKKKVVKKSLTEMEEEIKDFLGQMELAAEEDEISVSERKPAIKKLTMLNDVVDMLTKRDMQRLLLDFDLLTICKRWIQPLPNGKLGNVTVRQKLLSAIGNMNGEHGITPDDLKRSELGRTCMVLYKHKSESPQIKRLLRNLIEQWSRPIFQKSGNMRDLEKVHAMRGETSINALSRQQQYEQRAMQMASSRGGGGGSGNASGSGRNKQDLDSLITTGKKASTESGINRVRVPYSTGFQYTVRPMAKSPNAAASPGEKGGGRGRGGNGGDKMRTGSETGEIRGKLSKRMLEKGRVVGKNQRSANISIEGRATKG